MRLKVLDLLKKINIVKKVCTHLIGKEHTDYHRYFVGLMFMFVGVALAKFTHDLTLPVHFACDTAGYFLHGLGAVPFIETVLSQQDE